MKSLTKLSFVIISLIFLLSCSKDNTTNPQATATMEDYMPLTIGSWWKYEQYDIDEFGNKINKDIITYIVSDIHVIDGKQAYDIAVKKENNDTTYDGMIFYTFEDCKLLLYYNHPEVIERYGWLIIADLNSEKWTLKDTIEVYDSADYHHEYFEKWTIKKGNEKIFTIKNKSILAQEFISEKVFITKYTMDGIEYIDTSDFIAHDWYGKNVGRIYSTSIFKMSDKNMPWPFILENSETSLVDYEIK